MAKNIACGVCALLVFSTYLFLAQMEQVPLFSAQMELVHLFFAFAPSNPIFGSAGGVGPGPPRTANSTALGILLYWLREVLELTVL